MKKIGVTQIVIVDDHVAYREALAQILRGCPDFEVLGLGGSADEAVCLARQFEPDVLLLDLEMPGCGLEAARRLAHSSPTVEVFVLTFSNDPLNRAEAHRAGVRQYLLKGISSRELAEAIRSRGVE